MGSPSFWALMRERYSYARLLIQLSMKYEPERGHLMQQQQFAQTDAGD
jgi:hypothetical protein